jgi:hypothetical protein
MRSVIPKLQSDFDGPCPCLSRSREIRCEDDAGGHVHIRVLNCGTVTSTWRAVHIRWHELRRHGSMRAAISGVLILQSVSVCISDVSTPQPDSHYILELHVRNLP